VPFCGTASRTAYFAPAVRSVDRELRTSKQQV
jgi:hypothetical protein